MALVALFDEDGADAFFEEFRIGCAADGGIDEGERDAERHNGLQWCDAWNHERTLRRNASTNIHVRVSGDGRNVARGGWGAGISGYGVRQLGESRGT
jgi:hypothetical protein